MLALLAAAVQGTGATTAPAARELLVVRAASPVRAPGELAGRLVCFIIGTPAEDALNAWAAVSGVAVERLPFQEPDEMTDAFAVGKCAAAALNRAEAPPGARVLAALPAAAIATDIPSIPLEAGAKR